MAALQALANILPTRTQVELQGILQSLRTWYAGVDATNGASLRGMINGVLDIVPELWDNATLDDNATMDLRNQCLTVWNDIYAVDDRMDWVGTRWADVRAMIKIVKAERKAAILPAPNPGPGPGPQGVKAVYEWGDEKPSGMAVNGTVPTKLVRDAIAEALMDEDDDVGIVTVNGKQWTVNKKTPKQALAPKVKGVGIDEVLGRFRDDSVFGKDYKRVAIKVLRDIATRASSVEQFVRMTFADMSINHKERFEQLTLSAITVDTMLRGHAGSSEEVIKADDTLELHLSSIARAEYVSKTGNLQGSKAISGVQSFLLPHDVIEDAAKYTVNQSKLRGSLKGMSGASYGGGESYASTFVPMSARVCYGCGETGHVLDQCPNLTADEKKKKKTELQAEKGKGKGGKKVKFEKK